MSNFLEPKNDPSDQMLSQEASGNIQPTYVFEEYTQKDLEIMKAKSKMNKIKEEKKKELELQEKIKSIKKKQEEQIAKYIGDIELTNPDVELVVNREDDFDNCRATESAQIEAILNSNREKSDINQFKLARAEIIYKKPKLTLDGEKEDSEDDVLNFDKNISFKRPAKKSKGKEKEKVQESNSDEDEDEEEEARETITKKGPRFNFVNRAIKRKKGDDKDEDNILNIISASKRQKISERTEKDATTEKKQTGIEEKKEEIPDTLKGLMAYSSDSDE
ncbi:unnamed protein product [Moneuplotes crassus]|uniref:Uncharacterized protein n=1 Tax=Euplotes crassus TaxID=5936 RepID=A0AAD1XL99_EUPCR|nr:unnamed protein product [Moneuplotes crassus]